ncbi:MAG: Flp pilus assembly protein CpaB [Methylovirgula sp.]
MKSSRLLILGTALAAGVGAAIMVVTSKPPQPERSRIVRVPVATDDVLVATKSLAIGTVIQNGDLRWQSWPKSNMPPDVISKSKMPNALADFMTALVRLPLNAGEPIFPNRLIKAGAAGFMAAILPSGMRAVAINIDQQGSQTAGNFILPNDHVDVIHTYRDEQAAKAGAADPTVSETLLRNIRVLAIGQNIQDRNNERVAAGSNATLELTPQQVEIIIRAQRVGQLSLALRSMTDNKASQKAPPPAQNDMTIVRYGVPIETRSQ